MFGIKIMSENQLLNGYANSIGYNVLQLQEVAKFVTENFRLLLNFLRNVNVNLPLNLPFLVTAVMPSVFYLFQFSVSFPHRFKVGNNFNHLVMKKPTYFQLQIFLFIIQILIFAILISQHL